MNGHFHFSLEYFLNFMTSPHVTSVPRKRLPEPFRQNRLLLSPGQTVQHIELVFLSFYFVFWIDYTAISPARVWVFQRQTLSHSPPNLPCPWELLSKRSLYSTEPKSTWLYGILFFLILSKIRKQWKERWSLRLMNNTAQQTWTTTREGMVSFFACLLWDAYVDLHTAVPAISESKC